MTATTSRKPAEARPWMKAHPGGTVVELGVGLETQFQRCDDGQVRWLCIDVPEAMAVRDRFIKPTQRSRHIARSALDPSWMDQVDAPRGLFVTAQGLFMYFHEQDVRRLLVAVIERFPGVEIMLDVTPPWFSRKTLALVLKDCAATPGLRDMPPCIVHVRTEG